MLHFCSPTSIVWICWICSSLNVVPWQLIIKAAPLELFPKQKSKLLRWFEVLRGTIYFKKQRYAPENWWIVWRYKSWITFSKKWSHFFLKDVLIFWIKKKSNLFEEWSFLFWGGAGVTVYNFLGGEGFVCGHLLRFITPKKNHHVWSLGGILLVEITELPVKVGRYHWKKEHVVQIRGD